MAFMLAAFGQIPINDYMIGRLADGEWRARIYGVRYVVSFTVLAAALPLIAFVYETLGLRRAVPRAGGVGRGHPGRRVDAAAAPAAAASVPAGVGRLALSRHQHARADDHWLRAARNSPAARTPRSASAAAARLPLRVKPEAPRGPRSWSPSLAQWSGSPATAVALHLGAAAERIALALHDQRRAGERLQMRRAQLLGLLGRMERVAEAHEPGDALRSANSSSATRLATRPPIDLPPMISGPPGGTRGDGRAILVHQPLGLGRRLARAALRGAPPCRRTRSAKRAMPRSRQQLGNGRQERASPCRPPAPWAHRKRARARRAGGQREISAGSCRSLGPPV